MIEQRMRSLYEDARTITEQLVDTVNPDVIHDAIIEIYYEGYRAAREQVAREIEEYCDCITLMGDMCGHLESAAIARGTND